MRPAIPETTRRGLLAALTVVSLGSGCRCEPAKPMCAEISSYDECRAAKHCSAVLVDGLDGPGMECELRPGFADGVPLTEMAVTLPSGIELDCPEGTELAGDKRASAWCERPGGTRHGPLRTWRRKSGKLREATQYVDGAEHGVHEEWHDNGRLQSRSTYERGVRVGVSTSWHDNGQMSYRQVEPPGLIEWWQPDGTKFKEALYRDGAELWQRNLADGRLGEKERTVTTPGGETRRYFYYLDDRPRMEYGTVDGELNGPSLTWYPDESKHSEARYVAGRLQEKYVEWDPRGVVVRECAGPAVTVETCTYQNGYTPETAPKLPPGAP